MEGNGIRESASRSSLKSIKNSAHLVGSSDLSGTDIGLALSASMCSVSLGSGTRNALVSDLSATGGSTRSGGVIEGSPRARPESFSEVGRFVVSEDATPRRTGEDFSMTSTPEMSSKSGVGGISFSEAPIDEVLSPGYE